MKPSFAFLLIHDGRGYKDRCIESAKVHMPEPNFFITVDDSEHRLGFAGAVQHGWEQVATTGVDFCFHCEEDFLFNRWVPIYRMMAVLKRKPYLAQMLLRRQPWGVREVELGGFINANPDQYKQVTDFGDVYIEHRMFWSTNPSLFSTGFCHQGWPQVENSEGIFSHRLMEDPNLRFGIWGAKSDPPMVEHIGAERKGYGY